MNQSIDFGGFEKHSKLDWIEDVIRELNGEDPLKILRWKDDSGLVISPIYFKEDLEGGSLDITAISGTNNSWLNLVPLKMTDLRTTSYQSLDDFCDGYRADCDGTDVELQNLRDLLSLKKPVFFTDPSESLLDKLNELRDPDFKGSVGLEPIRYVNSDDHLNEFCNRIIEHPLAQPSNRPFGLINISANQFTEAGAGMVSEIALSISILAEYYRSLQTSEASNALIANTIEITTSTGQNYFQEIAKLRAYNILTATIKEAFRIKDSQPLAIHGSSSLRFKSFIEQENNLIRNTVEAMACAIGGCKTITIFPHKLGEYSSGPARIALNVSNILRHESLMGRVVDPAAGSYYLESLTRALIDRAWTLFLEIEEMGGFLKSRSTGWVEEQIMRDKAELKNRMESNKINLVGVNKYGSEVRDNVKSAAFVKSFRLAEEFEKK